MKKNEFMELLVEGCKAYCYSMGIFNPFQQ